jgi:membrane-associated protein
MLLGMDWMDPGWWLDQFGEAFFWISLLIIFVECGLFFPFLPGDTLLFAMGLFIATDKIDVVPGPHGLDLFARSGLFTSPPSSATSSATRSAARSGHRSTSATAGS